MLHGNVASLIAVSKLADDGKCPLPVGVVASRSQDTIDSLPHNGRNRDSALRGQLLQSTSLLVGQLDLRSDDDIMLSHSAIMLLPSA